ncbi:MAG: hypothetical protein RLZZ444_2809 [Pseudomonadota bacterium]
MMTEPADLTINGGLAVLSLRRGAEGNRLGREMLASLDRAVMRLASEESLRALLIRADGPRFCVGGAIDEFSAGGDIADYLDQVLEVGHRAMKILTALPCPVISAVQGPVAGAGIGLALSADFVIAGRSMVLRAGYPALGLTPDFGVSWLLTKLAGVRHATDILLTNRPVSAEECARLGLVGSVVEDDLLETEARSLLDRLGKGPTQALAGMKQLIARARHQDYAAHLDDERAVMLDAARTRDASEGIMAFIARRGPVFSGN